MSSSAEVAAEPNGAPAAPDNPNPALEFRSVSAGYSEGLILRDVSLQVKTGALTALLGPNGAGKSTLLKTASGLLTPATGLVLLEGQEIQGLAPERRARMGLGHITEGRGIYRSLTVRET